MVLKGVNKNGHQKLLFKGSFMAIGWFCVKPVKARVVSTVECEFESSIQ